VIRFLSHTISDPIPVYGNPSAAIENQSLKSINNGDSCQTHRIGIENHWGTHVDCPAHFFLNGKKVNDYEETFWHFSHPEIIKISPEPNELITKHQFESRLTSDTDLLILNTGWAKLRGTDNYSCHNPGLHPEIGLWLRRLYPEIRAIGFDLVSISSYQNREMGRKAHQAFLDPDGYGNPILIIEDMFIPDVADPYSLERVLVAPIKVSGIDSAPCTIFGYYGDASDNSFIRY